MKTPYPKLTPSQATFLQKFIPKGYSLQVLYSEEKRRRVQKVDDNYLTEYIVSPNNKKTNDNQRTLKEADKLSDQHNPLNSVESQAKYIQQAHTDPKKGQSHAKNNVFLGKIVQKLLAHRSSLPFRVPVDLTKQNVPKYSQIIKQPMDLSTIQQKIADNEYSSWTQLDSDINKIITNSYTFNPKDTTYHTYTKQFEAYYNKITQHELQSPIIFKQFPRQPDHTHQNIIQETPTKKIQKTSSTSAKKIQKVQQQKQQHSPHPKYKTQSTTAPTQKHNKHSFTLVNQLTPQDRQTIFAKIQKLSAHQMQLLITLVFGDTLQTDWTQIELDLKLLPNNKFTQLQQYLKQQ